MVVNIIERLSKNGIVYGVFSAINTENGDLLEARHRIWGE